MNQRLHAVAATVAAFALLGAAPLSASAQNVAVVNGKAVPKSRVDALLQQVTASGRPRTPELEKQVQEEVIAREVFMQEAERRGLQGSDEVRTQLEFARQQIIIRALFSDFQKKNPVTDAEIKAEYDKFRAQVGEREFKARHILVEKEDEARALIAQLRGGANFADLAKRASKDPGSAANGGDLDWAAPGSYVKEFADAMTRLQKGQTSEAPVRSQFGFHIIRVDDIRQAQVPSMEELRPQIAQNLQQQKLQNFQEDLRKKARIQ
jgi:peptidyl-prolyl cis-trans isomerase C